MLTTACLLLSLAFAPKVKAVFSGDFNHAFRLEVTVGGKTRRILKAWDVPRLPSAPISDGDHEGVAYHGSLFKASNLNIVNVNTKAELTLQPPSTIPPGIGILYCQGAFALKKGMLWVYAWCDFDTMGEPAKAVCAFLVDEKDGKPVQVKAIDMAGVTGGPYGVKLRRRGDTLIAMNGHGALGFLNTKTFEFRIVNKDGYAKPGTAPSLWPQGGAIVSDSGRVYWQEGDTLMLWDWPSGKWKTVRSLKPHTWGAPQAWMEAYGVGDDDLLVSTDSIALARKGRVFYIKAFPNGSDGIWELFLDRSLGVGVVWRISPDKPGYAGSFLSLRDLKEICPITASK